MAVDRVERLLRKVARALNEAGVTYALVGGNAVAAWVATVDEGAVRATKDVDLLVRRRDMSAISAALSSANLMPVEVLGVTMFLDRKRPNPKTGVHILFAKERVRPDYAHPAPDPSRSVTAKGGYRVIQLGPLVAMKLQALRDIDRVHIRDLIAVGLIGSALVRRLPPDLRERFRAVQQST